MPNNPLTLSRRHVLGDLYSQCNAIDSIPVYWHDVLGNPVGFVDESAGQYADAFVFHVGEEFCRKLGAGQLQCRFNYEYVDEELGRSTKGKRRVQLISFVLTPPKIDGVKDRLARDVVLRTV